MIIDGAYGEGGGQILRTAVAMSAITQKPIKIINIRKNRKPSGLRPQHLTGILAAAELCNAKLKGAKIGSIGLEFTSSKIKGGKYRFDVGTAGSVTLVLQTLVPIACYADKPTELEIIGGTDVKMAPTVDYFDKVLCRTLRGMGIKIEFKVIKHGFYPKGGGKISAKIQLSKELKSLILKEQGKIRRLDIRSFASKQLKKADVAERQIQGFESLFKRKIDCRFAQYVESLSAGTSITAHVHCNSVIGASALGERGKPAEEVGKECAEELLKEIESGATVDHRLADQLIPYLALAKGGEFRTSRISEHLKTNIWIVEKFLPIKFEIKGKVVRCNKL